MVAAYQAIGTFAGNAATLSPAWPTHQADDIGLLIVTAAGGTTLTLTVPAGFVEAANSPQATGTTTAGAQVRVWWCRAINSAMGAPTVTASADFLYGGIVTVRGGQPWGDPFDATSGGVKASASTTSTIPGFTTTADNIAYIGVSARDTDSAAAAYSGEANASLTSLTERLDAGVTTGLGGGLGVYSATKGAAGSVSNTTSTVSSSINAYWAGAIKSAGTPYYPGQGAAGDCRVIHYEGFDLADSAAVTSLATGQWASSTAGCTVNTQSSALRFTLAGVAGGYAELGGAYMGYPLDLGDVWEMQFEYSWSAVAAEAYLGFFIGDSHWAGGVPNNGIGIAVATTGNTITLQQSTATSQSNVSVVAYTAVAGQRVRMRWRRVGDYHWVKAWDLPGPEPYSWLVLAEARPFQGIAYQTLMMGIFGGNVAAATQLNFDNVYVSSLDRVARRLAGR